MPQLHRETRMFRPKWYTILAISRRHPVLFTNLLAHYLARKP